jgi:Domain of unknown function (DUF4403)
MLHYAYGTALILMFSLFFACKSGSKVTNAPRPPEQYATLQDTPQVGTITIPIHITTDELTRSLNKTLSAQALYEDFSYDDGGGDNLMLSAWLSQGLTVFVSGNTLKYRIPMKLWMKKKFLIGEAEATGELALGFKTTYTINPDWSLSTQTVVEYHEWPVPPALKTPLGNIGVEAISNLALNRSKTTLAQSLDRVISQQMSLRPYVQDAWDAIQIPTLLSEDYKMWLKTTPTSIGMSPLKSYNNTITATIKVDCLNDVTFGEQPAFRGNSPLPPLTTTDEVPEDFELRFVTDITYAEAERISKGMIVGQTFESGGKKVTVNDLKIWGNSDQLVVNTNLAGAFNGQIYFIGKPRFNSTKNQIEMTDLDYQVDTKSMLLRSASWIFQGPIKRQMAQAMTFPLDENLAELKKSVQETLNRYEITPGVILTGQLADIQVQDIRLTPQGIRIYLYSKGKVNVTVEGL